MNNTIVSQGRKSFTIQAFVPFAGLSLAVAAVAGLGLRNDAHTSAAMRQAVQVSRPVPVEQPATVYVVSSVDKAEELRTLAFQETGMMPKVVLAESDEAHMWLGASSAAWAHDASSNVIDLRN
jgi:hypothetical protein